MTPNPRLFDAGDDASRLMPLATPLMVGGLSPRVLTEMEPLFRAYGLMPMQAGGGGSGDAGPEIKIEPGCVLGVPLVEGDVDMSAVGTCTEVIGKHVLAFGHSFNSEGRVSLPLAGGAVQGGVGFPFRRLGPPLPRGGRDERGDPAGRRPDGSVRGRHRLHPGAG